MRAGSLVTLKLDEDLVQHRGEAHWRYTLFNKGMLTICFDFHNLLSFSEREN